MGGRTHLVLVPGFGGFDAFGSLKYYAGIREIFTARRTKEPLVLHFFDNLPTAAVSTRAQALADYLDKRVERREFQGEDRLVLIGHSTGGLDIRAVIERYGRPDVRRRVAKVVFLSVPHHGTNLADFVDANMGVVRAAVLPLRAAVGHHPPDAAIDPVLVPFLAILRRLEGPLDILEAARDVGRETSAQHDADPWVAAQSRLIASEVALWLRNISDDFHAVHDLKSEAPRAPDATKWKGIAVRTYATIGERPFAPRRGEGARTASPPLASVLRRALLRGAMKRSDYVYRACYLACSAGPFARDGVRARWFGKRRPTTWSADADEYAPERSDNDGIVNTASMFWPWDPEPRLVLGDHGDIIGHYRLVDVSSASDHVVPPRKYERYDLLGSKTSRAFGDADLHAVWNEIFDFAASK